MCVKRVLKLLGLSVNIGAVEALQSWLLTGFLPLPLGKFSRRFPSA